MKIALVRGDFVAPWELQNFYGLLPENRVTLFTGNFPVSNLNNIEGIERVSLLSPVDINFGHVSRYKMAILNRLFSDAHLLFGLEDSLKGYDIAHCAETYYGYTLQCINAKHYGNVKKIVSTVWENIPHNNESLLGRKEKKTISFNNIDLFLAVTKTAQKTLIDEGCDRSRTHVLYPGVSLQKFYPAKKLNKRLQLLFVARLEVEKGIIILLKLFNKYRREFDNVDLTVIGTGSLESYAKSFVQNNKITNIKIKGGVSYDSLPAYYRMSDLLVHPAIGSKTWVEQYGMVLIEALASGIPVIGVDVGSIKEIVGDGGIVVNPTDFENTLLNVIKHRDLINEMSAKALSRAKKYFDSSKYSIELEQLYKEILKTNAKQ